MNGIRRLFLCGWLAALSFTAQGQLSLSGLSPSHGPAGITVTLNGAGFNPAATNQIQLNGALIAIGTINPTNISFTVPAGAQSGLVSLTVNGVTFTNMQPFTLDRQISGVLALPPNVSPAGYQVASFYAIVPPATNDLSFSVAAPADTISFVWAFRTENDPVFLAPAPTSTNHVVINADSTTKALAFLSPLVATRDDARSQQILGALASLPQEPVLASLISGLSADGVDYLNDQRYQNALTNVVTALLSQLQMTQARLNSLFDIRPGAVDGTWLDDLTNGIEYLGTGVRLQSSIFDLNKTDPEDYGLKLDGIDSRPNPVDWVVKIFQLTQGQFPRGRESVNELVYNSTPVKLDLEPLARGFIHSSQSSAKLDLLEGVSLWILEHTLYPPDAPQADPNIFTLDRQIPAVYISEAYSGNLIYGAEVIPGVTQSGLINRIGGDPEWNTAFAANITIAAIDTASLLVDVKGLTESLLSNTKIYLAVATEVAKTVQIQRNNGTLTEASAFDILKAASNGFIKEASKQLLEAGGEKIAKAFLKCAFKTVAGVFDVSSKISTAGQALERFGGIAFPVILALERTVAIVGEPFYPVIQNFYPTTGRSGDLVRIQGYNFPDDLAGLTVSFCLFSGTTSETNVPPTVILPAQVVATTNNAILVVAPTNWQSSFPDGKAFICIQTTNFSETITTAALPPPYQQFQFKPNPQIFSVYPNPALSSGMLLVSGTNFLPGAIYNNQVILDGSPYSAQVQNSDDHTISIILSYLSPGSHKLQIQIAGETSDPFTFTVQNPISRASGYSTGLSITVSKLDLSNTPDGQISLLEAVLIANGTLGRPIETHLPCESLPPTDPGYCPPQPRESDHITGLVNGAGGGPKSVDFIGVDFSLGASNVVVHGTLPAFSNGDTYNLGNVTLDGGGSSQDALPLNGATNVSVSSVIYQNFGGHGIHFLNGATANQISYVTIKNCGGEGVFFDGQAENNYLIGTMVSGSGKNGLHLSGAQVRLNNVDLPGVGQAASLGTYNNNGAYGILLDNGAQYNTVMPGTVRNNPLGGVLVAGSTTAWNIIGRNFDVIPRLYDIYNNGGPGIHLAPGVHNTILHYLNPAGNHGDGILLEGPDCFSNQVDSVYTGMNYFGTGATPTAPSALPNLGSGIHLMNGAHDNLLGNLVYNLSFSGRGSIVANRDDGILLEGSGTSNNVINRMHIGSIEPATFSPPYYFPNGLNGIHIRNGSHGNKLGDEESYLDLHVMASANAGILIEDPGSDNNVIVGNQIGGNHEEGPIPDEGKNRFGIYLKNQVRGNVIGEPGDFTDIFIGYNEFVYRYANVVAYCKQAGIVLDNCGGSYDALGNLAGTNIIQNNKIGEQDFGLNSPNAVGILVTNGAGGNIIGGPLPGQGNRILNNSTAGVHIGANRITAPTPRDFFLNNYFDQIPPPPSVTTGDPLQGPPPDVAVLVTDGSSGNVFGESVAAANIIQNHLVGVYIDSSASNVVRGNYITTNVIAGVIIHSGRGNTIGDTTRASGNRVFVNGTGGANRGGVLISGGGNNQLQSNLIGAPGLANQGVGTLVLNSPGNLIGAPAPSGNWIQANTSHGVQITGAASSGNQVLNNLIGLDQNSQPAGNKGDGIHLDTGAHANMIGGASSVVRFGNLIQAPAPNTISFNGGAGVAVTGATTVGNSIINNVITANTTLGIDNNNGGNHLIPPPLQTTYDGSTMTGQVSDTAAVPPGSLIQIFSDPGPQNPEGAQIIGEGLVAADGTWSIPVGAPLNPFITMTSTHAADGSTSEFGTGTAFNVGFSVQGSGNSQNQSVPAGTNLLPVLQFTLAALNADVHVSGITFTANGSTAPSSLVNAVNLYRDSNGNGVIDPGDNLLAGPVAFPASTNRITLNVNTAIIANTSQQWLLAYSLSPSAPAGTTFTASITNAQAVVAQFVNPVDVVVPPGGRFPVKSPLFTVNGAMGAQPTVGGGLLRPGRGFQLTLQGVEGQTYRIQASSNLIAWTNLSSVTLSGPSFLFLDSSATNFPERFYRAVSP